MKAYINQLTSDPEKFGSVVLDNVINICIRLKEHVVDNPVYGEYDVLQIMCISDGEYMEVDNVCSVEVE